MSLATQLIYGIYLSGRNYDVSFFNQDARKLLCELQPEIQKASEAKDCAQVLAHARTILAKIDQIIKKDKTIRQPQLSPQAKKQLQNADFDDASISELIKEHFDEIKLDTNIPRAIDYKLFLDENNPEEKTIICPPLGDLSEYLQIFNPLKSESLSKSKS